MHLTICTVYRYSLIFDTGKINFTFPCQTYPDMEISTVSKWILPWTESTLDQCKSGSGLPILLIVQTGQVEWARKTHDWMETMWKTPEAGKLGVCLISAIRLNHRPVPPFWKDVVFGYRELSEDEVKKFGRLSGQHQSGVEFLTFTAEPAKWEAFSLVKATL